MKKKKKYKIIYTCILLGALIMIGVLSFAIYKLTTEYIPQQKEAQRYEELRELRFQPEETDDASDKSKTVETTLKGETIPSYSLEQLFSMNSDMVGWLTVPDTQIDYPVMHTPFDVEHYLHTDFDGNYSFTGCLFVGDNCDIDSDIFIIYGHNMNSGAMFGDLDMYTYQDYFEQHRDVILYTRDEKRLYRVFAAFEGYIDDTEVGKDGFRYYNSVGEKTE